ncbi:MAG: sulfatase-like hydrolase/transferase [Planctomycetaceae bacterium]|nr:sulfatase-like hydrolase/transferase [Planctomycetaceae bacterium]
MVDAMAGRVLKALDEAQMTDNTLVIFSSDNGPTWYPEDVKRFHHDSAGGWRGMKADAWEAGHRVPFLVRWPNVVSPGTVSDQTICFTDVLATFAAITGYDLQPEDGPDSFDFSPILRGEADAERGRPCLLVQSGGGFMTVRQDGWKLIEGLGSGGFSDPKRIRPEPGGPTGQLYNLKEDPAEQQDLFTAEPQKVEELRQLWHSIRDAGRHR